MWFLRLGPAPRWCRGFGSSAQAREARTGHGRASEVSWEVVTSDHASVAEKFLRVFLGGFALQSFFKKGFPEGFGVQFSEGFGDWGGVGVCVGGAGGPWGLQV